MSSDEISLNPQQLVVFQNDDDERTNTNTNTNANTNNNNNNNNLRYNCGTQQQRRVGSDPAGPKMFSSSSSSIDRTDRFFPSQGPQPEFRRNIFSSENRDPPPNLPTWHTAAPTDDSDADDDDDDDDDEDDDVDDDDDDHNTNNNINNNSSNKNNISVSDSVNEKVGNGNGNGKSKHHSTFVKDGNIVTQASANLNYGNAVVTVAEQPDGEMYYSQYLQAAVAQGSNAGGSGQKDLVVENGCGFSGRRDVSLVSTESGDSLRAILSDPVTGALMDDAMILPCGHSFGGGGIQSIIRMKACYTCSQSVSEDSIAPNLSLRAAVQAFRREDELQFYRSSKRRRERFDQDKGSYGDSTLMDPPRGRGVQFPFAVTDRVIIKGNKRTPQRFVGREAVVTTQCLNGWYVVKTLDNAESVKLQYRSLAKVSDDPSKPMSSKMAPNWL